MNQTQKRVGISVILLIVAGWILTTQAQTAPSSEEISRYSGLLLAVIKGDVKQVEAIVKNGAKIDIRDSYGRTPLHVATYSRHHEIMRNLVKAGADPNALDSDRYDIVTIAAVANDPATLKVALSLGASAKNITSPYDGTALIAAAHLGHVEVVRLLIEAGAPLNHINNLGWTALIESIVLGDGGSQQTETLRALVKAGADVYLTDRNNLTPLQLAQSRGYEEMVAILQQAIKKGHARRQGSRLIKTNRFFFSS